MSMSFRSRVLLALIAVPLLSFSAFAQDRAVALRDITNQQVDERRLREAVASRTLTWLTGSSSNNDYISVGRTANFFGFVALRVSSGQSLTRSAVAQDTLAVLTDDQRGGLVALLEDQKPAHERTLNARHQMNRALEGMLVGEVISEEAFLELGRVYGAAEAELGRVIGQRLGDVAQTLTPDQQMALHDIRTAYISGQGDQIARQPARLRLSQEDKQELVNLAARLLSWTTGSQEFNDFEVVGKPSQHFGFVSLRIESNHGVQRGSVANEVLALLRPDQQQMLDAAAIQNAEVFEDFLAVRAQLMRTLEGALSGATIDASQVAQIGASVGEIEASMTWAQALAMLNVRNSLSDAQSADLLAMRAKYTGTILDTLPDDPIERGRQLFAQCVLCHSATGELAVGPDLTRIVGKRIAADPSFEGYSPALSAFGHAQGAWNEALLDSFLKSPKALVPGTSMGFDGFDAEQDRAALIAYLRSRED